VLKAKDKRDQEIERNMGLVIRFSDKGRGRDKEKKREKGKESEQGSNTKRVEDQIAFMMAGN